MDYEQSQSFAFWEAQTIHFQHADYSLRAGNIQGQLPQSTWLNWRRRKEQKGPRLQEQEA